MCMKGKMVKRAVICFALVYMLSGQAFAGGKSEVKKPVEVKFFNGKTETAEWMSKKIDQFNAENPDIKVVHEFQKDASNVIKMKFASGDYPDITTVYSQDYVDQNLFVDLSGETQWWSRLNPAVKDMCTDIKSGKQYRIATNLTMAGLYYNKSIFADAGVAEPGTFKEFVEVLTIIKAKKPGVVPFFMGGKDSWMLGHLVEFMAHGMIKQKYGNLEARRAFITNDQMKLDFDKQDGSVNSFARAIIQLRDAGLMNADLVTATYDDQITAFATGKAAVISQGMWALGAILEKNPGMKDIGFCPYPAVIEGMKPVILSAEDSAYVIVSKSKNQEQAKKFLSYLFRADVQKEYSEFLKSPSAFTDVAADWGVLKDEVAKALKKGTNIGFTESPAGFSGDDAGRMVQALYAGQYKASIDFAMTYKTEWDKAWTAGSRK